MKRFQMFRYLPLVAIGLLMLITTPSIGQEGSPEERLQAARSRMGDSEYDACFDDLTAISNDFPNTKWDAVARLDRAYLLGAVYRNTTRAKALYVSVVQDFPNSKYSFFAESGIADIELLRERRPFSEYLSRMDALIRRAGGVGLDQILRNPELNPVPIAGLRACQGITSTFLASGSCRA